MTKQAKKVKIVEYDYDVLTGQNTNTKHYYSEICNPGTDQLSATMNQLVQNINKTYDVRNRLTNQTSEFLNYTLFYDNQNLPTYLNQNVNQSQNWNGNINGITIDYTINNSSLNIISPASAISAFGEQTVYGYEYDQLNRLIKADATVGSIVSNHGQITASYGVGDVFYNFDKIGNITDLQRGNKLYQPTPTSPFFLEQTAFDYQYDLSNNQLTAVNGTNSNTPSRHYTYDDNGNLASDDFREINTVDYYRGNYPYHIKKQNQIIDYLYGSNDIRMYKRIANNSNTPQTEEYYLKDIGVLNMLTNEWTYYVGGLMREAKIKPNTEQTPTAIASHSSNYYTSGHAQNLDLSFYISDYLGNTRMVYSPAQNCTHNSAPEFNLEYIADYYPYGKILREYVPTVREKYLTTQHERDNETGLDYRGARFYDSDVARFLSLDPLAAEYPSLSDYTYVADNPIMFIDPTGMAVESTHTDEDGNLIAEYNDGDDGVYKHANGTTKEDLDKVHNSLALMNPTGAGGEKVGGDDWNNLSREARESSMRQSYKVANARHLKGAQNSPFIKAFVGIASSPVAPWVGTVEGFRDGNYGKAALNIGLTFAPMLGGGSVTTADGFLFGSIGFTTTRNINVGLYASQNTLKYGTFKWSTIAPNSFTKSSYFGRNMLQITPKFQPALGTWSSQVIPSGTHLRIGLVGPQKGVGWGTWLQIYAPKGVQFVK